ASCPADPTVVAELVALDRSLDAFDRTQRTPRVVEARRRQVIRRVVPRHVTVRAAADLLPVHGRADSAVAVTLIPEPAVVSRAVPCRAHAEQAAGDDRKSGGAVLDAAGLEEMAAAMQVVRL